MIRWGAPHLLVLLAAVPVVALLMGAGAWLRRRRLGRLADPELVPRLTDSRSPRLAVIKALCLLAGLTALVVAAARPQWGEKLQVYRGRGIDVVIVLDASRSMLATDVAPSRLARAKTQVAALLDNLATDRVGIVAFAGTAQVMCPLTSDVEAAKLFLDLVDPDNMPRPGTNIQQAVEAAASLFDPIAETSRALVLVTDGESLDGDPVAATQLAADRRIHIFAVGVGTPEGSTVPESQGGATRYEKDENGNVVVSRLAERLLLVMAKATDGRYFRSESINLDQFAAALDRLEKRAIAGGEYVEYEERYQYFLLAAFVLILCGLFLSDRRSGWFPRLAPAWPRFLKPRRRRPTASEIGPAGAALLIAMLAGLAAPACANVGSSMRRGLALEKKGKQDEAVQAFQQALMLEPDNVRIHYDIGRALYEKQQPAEAADHFQLGLLSKSRRLRERSLYNLGNCQFRQDQLDEAIASYTQALLLRPDDRQAKENLEYCWKLKQEQQQKKQQPDSTQKNPKSGQQQQQQQQPQQRPQQAQAQKGAIPKDQADRMLQALTEREKENMKNQPKKPPAEQRGGKDW